MKTSDSNLACSCLVLPNINRRVNLSICSLRCDRVPLLCHGCGIPVFPQPVQMTSELPEHSWRCWVMNSRDLSFYQYQAWCGYKTGKAVWTCLLKKNPHFIKKIKGKSRTKAEDLTSSSISFSSLSPWVPINISNCYWEEIRALKSVMCSEHFSSWVPAQMGSYQEL